MSKPDLNCSFCGKKKDQTSLLIAGIDAHICDLCIEQANGIIIQENKSLDKTEDKIGLISLEESIGDTATKLIGMSINKNIRMPGDVTDEEARIGYDKVFKDEN